MQTLITQNTSKTHSTEQIQVIVNPSMLRSDVEKKFYGDTRSSPKTFLKALQAQVEQLDGNTDIKKFIRSTLGGDAELWFDIISEDFTDFQGFRKIFLQYYFGEQVQSKIRESLFSGRWNENFGTSRERYAMRKFSIAKQLDPPMEEKDIIRYISRHFDRDVAEMIALHEITDINRMLDYLKRVDDTRRPRRMSREEWKESNVNYRRDGGRADQHQSEKHGNDERPYQSRNNQHKNYEKRTEYKPREANYRNNGGNQRNYDGENRGYRTNSVRREIRQSPRRRSNSNERWNQENQERENQNDTDTQHTDTKQERRNTDRNVKFDEIAIVHDTPKDSKHFL